MNRPLARKVALITGASRGIGRSIAVRLSSMGADIMVNYARNDEEAQKTVAMVEKNGSKAKALAANVGDLALIDTLVETTLKEFGRIDILVHNAALGAFKPVHKLRVNQWELSLDVNAKAFLVLAQKVLPDMEKRKEGIMVTISSLGAHRFIPNYGAIGISKAALETLVKYLAAEFAPKGIRVNCVSGGLVDTEAVQSFPDYEALKREVIRRTPAGRIGEPEDMARVVGFLCSEDARWIYGQTIVADGGLSMI